MEAKRSKYSFTWSASSYIPAWLVERLKRLGRRTTLSQQLQDYNMVHLGQNLLPLWCARYKRGSPTGCFGFFGWFQRRSFSALLLCLKREVDLVTHWGKSRKAKTNRTPTCSKRLWIGRVQDTRARCWSPRPGRLCAPRRGRWWPHSPRWSTSRWSRRQTKENLMLIINRHF